MTVAPPLDAIRAFIAQHAIPLEPAFLGRPFRDLLPTLEGLRAEVRRQGLWAPHLPREQGGLGLSLPAFAEVSAVLGESPIGHYLFNCQAPDVGNQLRTSSPTGHRHSAPPGSTPSCAGRSAAASR